MQFVTARKRAQQIAHRQGIYDFTHLGRNHFVKQEPEMRPKEEDEDDGAGEERDAISLASSDNIIVHRPGTKTATRTGRIVAKKRIRKRSPDLPDGTRRSHAKYTGPPKPPKAKVARKSRSKKQHVASPVPTPSPSPEPEELSSPPPPRREERPRPAKGLLFGGASFARKTAPSRPRSISMEREDDSVPAVDGSGINSDDDEESEEEEVVETGGATHDKEPSLGDDMLDEIPSLCSGILWREYVFLASPDDDDAAPATPARRPPHDWLDECELRLSNMLFAAGPERTKDCLEPVLKTFPRQADPVIKALTDLALWMIRKGPWRTKREEMGLLGEILGLQDKGKYWRGGGF